MRIHHTSWHTSFSLPQQSWHTKVDTQVDTIHKITQVVTRITLVFVTEECVANLNLRTNQINSQSLEDAPIRRVNFKKLWNWSQTFQNTEVNIENKISKDWRQNKNIIQDYVSFSPSTKDQNSTALWDTGRVYRIESWLKYSKYDDGAEACPSGQIYSCLATLVAEPQQADPPLLGELLSC